MGLIRNYHLDLKILTKPRNPAQWGWVEALEYFLSRFQDDKSRNKILAADTLSKRALNKKQK
jgi:hypothetical protein